MTGLPPGAVLVLVESNATYGRSMARRACREGARVVVLTRDPAWYPTAAQDGFEVRGVDTLDAAAVMQACLDERPAASTMAVTAGFEPSLPLAAATARRLGLPGPDPEAVRRSAVKDLMRRTLAGAHVRVPRFVVAHTPQQVARAYRELGGLPAVVKPTTTGGSIGVRLVHGPEEAAAHAATLIGQPDDRGAPTPHTVLVERYLLGDEYSVEILDGRAYGVTHKHVTRPPTFVELGHDYPVTRPDALLEAESAVRALGLTVGPAHVEVKVDDDGAAVIEVNPRLAGGGITDLVERTTGADLFGAAVRTAFGLPSTPPAAPRVSGAIRSLLAPGPGRVRAIEGVDRARALPGVVDVRVLTAPGAVVGGWGDSRDRLVSISAVAVRPEEAARRCEEALGLVDLRIDGRSTTARPA